MLEKVIDLPRGIDGLKAVGTVSKDDYEKVLEPLLDQARREGRRLRFLYQLGPEFEAFTPGAACAAIAWAGARSQVGRAPAPGVVQP